MAKEKKAYNKFFLFGLSHLVSADIFKPDLVGELDINNSIRPEARTEIQRRLLEGRKAIEKHTKPGDPIAFEYPEHITFEDFRKFYSRQLPETQLHRLWGNILKDHCNFYSSLADYARSIGRSVVSLELSARKIHSSLQQAFQKEFFLTEKRDRTDYLIRQKPDILFVKKVQRAKPKMVIVSRSHALYMEAVLKPKKVNYFPQVRLESRKIYMQTIMDQHREYRRKKLQRLRAGKEKTKTQKKKAQKKPR